MQFGNLRRAWTFGDGYTFGDGLLFGQYVYQTFERDSKARVRRPSFSVFVELHGDISSAVKNTSFQRQVEDSIKEPTYGTGQIVVVDTERAYIENGRTTFQAGQRVYVFAGFEGNNIPRFAGRIRQAYLQSDMRTISLSIAEDGYLLRTRKTSGDFSSYNTPKLMVDYLVSLIHDEVEWENETGAPTTFEFGNTDLDTRSLWAMIHGSTLCIQYQYLFDETGVLQCERRSSFYDTTYPRSHPKDFTEDYTFNDSNIEYMGHDSTADLINSKAVDYYEWLYGNTWDKAVTDTAYDEIWALAYLGNGIAIAGVSDGSNGRIARSTDYGLNWTDSGIKDNEAVYAITYLENGIALAGTSANGKILRSTDYGATWTDLGQQYGQASIRCFTDLGNGIVLAGTGIDGKILRSTDYGATWTDLGQQYGQDNIYSLESCGDGIALAGTHNDGKILRSTDYGATWTDLGQQGSEQAVYSLEYCDDGIALAGTWNLGSSPGKIFRSTDYGATWTDLGTQYSEDGIVCILHVEDSLILAGTADTAKILRSKDRGETWENLGSRYDVSWAVSMCAMDNEWLLMGTAIAGTATDRILLTSRERGNIKSRQDTDSTSKRKYGEYTDHDTDPLIGTVQNADKIIAQSLDWWAYPREIYKMKTPALPQLQLKDRIFVNSEEYSFISYFTIIGIQETISPNNYSCVFTILSEAERF